MKRCLKLTRNVGLPVASWLVSSVLVISPSKAATFALSEGALSFTNFSHSPSSTLTITDTNATSIFEGGNVATQADAIASLTVDPAEALSYSSTVGSGDNVGYLGIAESDVVIRGLFNIEENSTFSFNFASNLNLVTSIDDPEIENANASGDISFGLFDITQNRLLDFFSLAGNISTQGNNDFIGHEKVGNVTLYNAYTASDFRGNQEFATGYVDGYVERYFNNPTNIAVVEFKQNQVQVQASIPEPRMTLALILTGGVMGVVCKHHKSSDLAKK